MHRSDDSGTTENFTDYLYATAPDVWTSEPDGVWPLQSGEAAQGTSGVISAVQGGQGTVTYADASRAEGLGTVAVQVGDEFVEYSPEAAAAIVDASPFEEGRTEGDLADRDRPHHAGSGRLPDRPRQLHDRVRAVRGRRYRASSSRASWSYVASPEGQDAAAAAAGSAPISDIAPRAGRRGDRPDPSSPSGPGLRVQEAPCRETGAHSPSEERHRA